MEGLCPSLESIPQAVWKLLRSLDQAGERGWVVGGAVRDALMARNSEPDWDIATTAKPDQVMSLFRKVIPTGIAHGTVTVLLDGRSFEVTTLRGEAAYSDGRHPDEVQYLQSIETDLERRDFTVNAIAFDPLRQELRDPFGGRKDLQNGVLRAVGDPLRRFTEDGLRLLRAARFCATLEMSIEPNTRQAMAGAADTLDKISAERKRDELRKLLMARGPSRGLEVLLHTGLWPKVFRDHERLSTPPDSPEPLLRRVDSLPVQEAWRLAALLAACPLSGAQASDGPTATRWLRGMRFEKEVIASVSALVTKLSLCVPHADDTRAVRRFAVSVGPEILPGVLAIHEAEVKLDNPNHSEVSHLRQAIQRELQTGLPMTVAELAVKGGDLKKELGLEPGPTMGDILRELHRAVVDQAVNNDRAALLHRCRAFFSSTDE